MAHYGPPAGSYGGRQPSYGGIPPAGFGAPPPGFGTPGVDIPPGMPSQFQPPSNLPPNINFNAPVIRLGLDGGGRQNEPGGGHDRERGQRGGRGGNSDGMGGGRSRPGLGADPGRDRNIDRERQQVRENMLALQPPTREELARTVFVGGLGEGAPPDQLLEAILRCPGKLRRWIRARDANDKKCKFGFAEYEDVESLEAAAEILRGIEVPVFGRDGSIKKQDEEGIKKEDGDEEEEQRPKKMKLLVVVDEASMKYIEEWKGRRKEDENARQFRIDGCREELQSTITSMTNDASFYLNGTSINDRDGDTAMGDADNGDIEHVNLPGANLEEDLADIPAEMRAQVAEEIKSFRDRSIRRDIERLRQEEDMEREERKRAAPRASRLASPPPNGATSSSNGIPVGPRGQQGVHGAPAGPRGFRGAQLPNDYENGVVFVPGARREDPRIEISLNPEDDDAEESDGELERRRKARDGEVADREYQNMVKRWQGRERQRGMAQEREKTREDAEKRHFEKAREDMLHRLANWNDDDQMEKRRELYYRDRAEWGRARAIERAREEREDDQDRKAEERDKAETRRREAEARGQADDFLGSMGMGQPSAPVAAEQARPGFKISLGTAAAKTKQPTLPGPKRPLADVEGLLEDEEDAAAAGLKRPELKPLQDMSTVPISGQDLDEDEKAAARQQLAAEIPTETEILFAHPIKWAALTGPVIDAQIRPFVERKIVEYLGVQEDLIVDAVVDGIRDQRSPRAIQEELEGPLEDEAEVLVKKVWRLMVFWGECESRGLGE